ncbi:hypothetical protein N0V90_007368 [Kalmusia sp. IMI 367209]|nr:hypothetical protein N0V90_007368 [Kalmusia sp. IMI 367209]
MTDSHQAYYENESNSGRPIPRTNYPDILRSPRDTWKRVSSKPWPKNRSGSYPLEEEQPKKETAKEEKDQPERERDKRERLKMEEKEAKAREAGEQELLVLAREVEVREKARIEAQDADTSFEWAEWGNFHVPSNPLPPDAQLAPIPNNGQSSSYKQVLETMDTVSIEQEDNLFPSSILGPFENVDPADGPLDNMRAMLDAKARTGGKVFPETRLRDPEGIREGPPMKQKDKRDVEDDNASVISSYAASIFSIQSAASSATNLAKGSGYSVDEITTATEDLLALLQNDVDLTPLYLTAIKDPSIGPQRLQRNLRRIFKQYAEHLKTEAKDRLEFLASRLVSLKAGSMSQSIVEHCTGIAAKTRHGKLHKVRVEENYDDEWEEEDEVEEEAMFVDDTEFEDLIAFREFLLGSSAFETLRTRIQNFVLPKPSRTTRREIATKEDGKGIHLEIEDSERGNIKTARILGRIMRTFDAFLIAIGHLEPPLEPAMGI